MTSQHKNPRQLILDTALDIVEMEGMKALTQPRIAKLSGLRQSHLTYYFPRKADLYIALLEASHQRAESRGGGDPSLAEILATLFFEPERMRFFLSIVLEIGDDAELQPMLRAHAQGLTREVARQTGMGSDDPAIVAFVDEMRGLGLRALMEPGLAASGRQHVREVATRHGLQLGR